MFKINDKKKILKVFRENIYYVLKYRREYGCRYFVEIY